MANRTKIREFTAGIIAALLLHGCVLVIMWWRFSAGEVIGNPTVSDKPAIHAFIYTKKIAKHNVHHVDASAKQNFHPTASVKSASIKTSKALTQTKREEASESMSSGEINRLVQLLYQSVQAHQHYPRDALAQGRTGTASVMFRLFPDGHIEEISVVTSSGSSSLDQAAIVAVTESAPISEAGRFITQSQQFKVDVAFAL